MSAMLTVDIYVYSVEMKQLLQAAVYVNTNSRSSLPFVCLIYPKESFQDPDTNASMTVVDIHYRSTQDLFQLFKYFGIILEKVQPFNLQ